MTTTPPFISTRTALTSTPRVEYGNQVAAIRAAAVHGTDYSDTDIARLALTAIIEPGDTEAAALITTHGPVGALQLLVNADPAAATHLIDQTQNRYNPSRVARRLDLIAERGWRFLTPEDEAWPTRLNDLGEAAPVALWCWGDPDALSTANVTAITGSRAATNYGEHTAMSMASALSDAGHTIITGAAYGIDGMATRAALASRGRAVVVLAGGIDRLYPVAHHDLITRVAESGGAVISQAPTGTPPTKWRFLMRSRIITALADRTVIVEADTRSGALITAAAARTIGRPVFAVPGPVTSMTSAGCHDLIRDGHATLTTSANDLTPANPTR